jgi:hypothetical protein
MPSSRQPSEVLQLERVIESKRALLAYLRSHPKHLTIESYVCLADLLHKAGWRLQSEFWEKADHRFATLDAAQAELAVQISADKDRLLHLTVRNYRS